MNFAKAEYVLSSGYSMPMFGLALSMGYRLIDTAAIYGNEKIIGQALKKLLPKYKLTRQDIFLISKVPPTHHGESAMESLTQSIRDLGCDYIDLYLIHWPGSFEYSASDKENSNQRIKTWMVLTQAKNAGLIKSLGVSNYTVRHLKELFENSYEVRPCVNQIEWHPHWHQDEMYNYCNDNGILIQAYYSLGGVESTALMSEPAVLNVANMMNKTPSQVLLVWALQKNIAVIPRSTNQRHLKENCQLNFVIPPEQMISLSHLPQQKYGSNPDVVA
ncbi:hypothetical protein FQA39_LY04980 [Lamprigera yunnana]|nr:hypothetical protein FQA39_LY04980 [Lamprigera yunnana]